MPFQARPLIERPFSMTVRKKFWQRSSGKVILAQHRRKTSNTWFCRDFGVVWQTAASCALPAISRPAHRAMRAAAFRSAAQALNKASA
jgi:hypothetical protein